MIKISPWTMFFWESEIRTTIANMEQLVNVMGKYMQEYVLQYAYGLICGGENYFIARRQTEPFVRYTVPNVIDFPRYNMKCNGENKILRGTFHVVSCFPLHFMLYRGNLDYFLDRLFHIISTPEVQVYTVRTMHRNLVCF